MPERELYNTRLPDDLAKGVDQYSDDKEVSKSETLRRAVGEFLEDEGYPQDETESRLRRVAHPASELTLGEVLNFAVLLGLVAIHL